MTSRFWRGPFPRCCAGTVPDEYGDRGQPDEYGDRGQPDGGCRRSSYRSPLARARGDGGSLFTSPPWIRSVCDTYGSHRRRGSSPMPPDVRPTASHGCRSVTSAATGWSVCRSRTSRATRGRSGDMVVAGGRRAAHRRPTPDSLPGRCSADDGHQARASGGGRCFTTLGAPVPEIYRSPGLPPGGT